MRVKHSAVILSAILASICALGWSAILPRRPGRGMPALVVSYAVTGKKHGSQTASSKTKPTQAQRGHVSHTSPKIYEDDEVKVPIPAGWSISTKHHYQGSLLLEKDGYTLSLGYHSGHASGIIGGRFNELFGIPWFHRDETEQAGNCGLFLEQVPQAASRRLMFVNLIFDTLNPKVQDNCGIPNPLKSRTHVRGYPVQTYRRWFAGYFTTVVGRWFFQSNGVGCGVKAYTLTSSAKTPAELPLPEDPTLKKIINEAIDIVYSIHYKRCAPTSWS